MIFKTYAPLYWASGLQAIPLIQKDKRPAVGAWQTWGQQKIPDSEKEKWLNAYGDGNVGLPAGPGSNLCFIDIDVVAPELLALIEKTLPPSPWRRVGKKGCVLAYRYNGAKSFKIKTGPDQKPLIEFFSTSGQVVLPPSIHPETGEPYKSNVNLWEVVGQIPSLDPDIEKILRAALKIEGQIKLDISGVSNISDRVSAGGRDTALIKHAGLFSIDIIRGRKTLREAFDGIADWVETMAEHVDGDNIDLEKGQKRIVEFLLRDVRQKNLVLPKGWDEGISDEQKKMLGLDVLNEEDLSFDANEIQQMFLNELTAAESAGKHGSMQIVDRTLQRIARSQNCSEYETDHLLTIIKQHVGDIRIGSLRKGINAHKKVGIPGENHNEIAEAVLDDLKDLEMRFHQGSLWEWRGSHWGKKDSNEILRHISQRYGDLPAAKRQSDHSGIVKLLSSLVSKPLQTVAGVGINFSNGFLDSQLRLLPHDREFGATYELPYAYKPELRAGCPKFIQFLRTAWDDDDEKIESLRQAIAVTLFGIAPVYEKCFLLHGVPFSGKSVTLNIVESLVPREARTALAPQMFSDKYKTAELAGKLLNIAGELPDNKMIQSSLFKTIISGQGTMCERKNKDPFEFKSNCAHWFAANNLPQTKDVSDGFVRRWMIYGFYNRVPAELCNVNLAEELIGEEREAIVAWAVESITTILRDNRILVPRDSRALAAEMTHSINSIRCWFDDRIEMKSGAEMNEKVAYEDYRVWTMMNSHLRREMGDFKRTMRELAGLGAFKCSSTDSGEHTYSGIKLAGVKLRNT